MPLVKQIAEWSKNQMEKGRGDCHTNEIIIIEDLVKENVSNKPNTEGRQKTRVVFVTDPITYGQWHAQRERWIGLCHGNPTLAYPLMVKVLAAISDEAIKGLVEDGESDAG